MLPNPVFCTHFFLKSQFQFVAILNFYAFIWKFMNYIIKYEKHD